jgi:hypothetical protein
MGIAILVHQTDDLFPGFADGQNQRNLGSLSWSQDQALAQAQDGVEDESLAIAGFLQGAHWSGERPSSADKSAPVGLELQGFALGVFKRKAVRHINRWVVFPTRSAVREERLLLRNRLGLDEQLVEGRMLPVCVVRRQRKFNVTRQLEPAAARGTIDQRHPPNLDVIFRRDDHLGFTLNAIINAPEHGPVEREVG